MTKELFNKFLNNQCTPEELREVIHWVKTDDLNTDEKKLTLLNWQNYNAEGQFSEDNKFDSLLDKIHHKINISNNLEFGKNKISQSSKIFVWMSRAAAILLIPMMAFLFYNTTKKSQIINEYANAKVDSLEIIAPVGSKTIVQLSDGSEVFLNHGSKLKYPQKFTGLTRDVVLSGEAYFKVAHNPEKPFVVNTASLEIKALGTEFNVLAYPNENIIETTLVNGKVTLEEVNKSGKKNILGSMEPNQHVKYNAQTGEVTSTIGDVDRYTSWKEGRLIFKNEPIEQIVNKLNRWYNVEIVFENNNVKDLSYTATFVDETLFQILDLLQLATPIKYKTLPRQKLINGAFSKQKIVIGFK